LNIYREQFFLLLFDFSFSILFPFPALSLSLLFLLVSLSEQVHDDIVATQNVALHWNWIENKGASGRSFAVELFATFTSKNARDASKIND